ncbi:MAG: response regulator [Cystobacter sp.]
MIPAPLLPPTRVLLVEDDEDDFLLTRDCLKAIHSQRHSLTWVRTDEQALEQLTSSEHDVCLVDYQLGTVTGIELIASIRARGWSGPIIMLTGKEDDDIDQQAEAAGAADFLGKSQLTPTLLGRSIRYALQHARTLEALRRSQASFRELTDRLPEAISVIDGERLVYANPSLLGLVGCATQEELLGQSFVHLVERFLSEEDRVILQNDLLDARRSGRPIPTREVRITRKGGGHAIASLSQVPLTFDGRPCTLWSARDLTESRQLQLRLLHADRMASLGVLSAGVAHELNNPLAYTLSNLDHLEQCIQALPPVPRDEARELVSDVRTGATRVRDIVRQLRLFSRVDEDARPQPVEVNRVMDTAISMAMNELKHRARLVRDYGESLRVEADEGRLGQVFLNLLVNAAQALPEGRAEQHEIRIVTRPHLQGVRIEIHDTGPGIPEAHQERIFEPFFTTKPMGVGTGLGLSICHGIVTSFGGRMGVTSRVGQGSTFWIHLNATTAARPTAALSPLSMKPPGVPHDRSRRDRILVVDDEPMIGVAIRRTLQREYEVITTTSAREACARLMGGEHFDLVLSDVMMPEMSGVELHQEIAHRWPDLVGRIVFLSGGAFTPQARAFLNTVGTPRLDKPFSSEELRGLVRTRLAQAHLDAESA